MTSQNSPPPLRFRVEAPVPEPGYLTLGEGGPTYTAGEHEAWNRAELENHPDFQKWVADGLVKKLN
jgi:hypothetical protein